MAGKIKFGLDPKLSFKRAFFDRAQVDRKLGRAVSRILRQAGGFTRTTARRSMKKKSLKGGVGLYGQKTSAATGGMISGTGRPPLAYARTLKDKIYFYADTKRKRVIIGPTATGTGAAEALEYGGSVMGYAPEKVEMRIDPKDGKRKLMPAMAPASLSGNDRSPALFKNQRLKFKARPYMRPAFAIMMDNKLPQWLKDPSIPRSLKNSLKQQR